MEGTKSRNIKDYRNEKDKVLMPEAEQIANYRKPDGSGVSIYKISGINHVVTMAINGQTKDILCLGPEHAMAIFERCKEVIDKNYIGQA